MVLIYVALLLTTYIVPRKEIKLLLLTSVDNHRYVSVVFHIGDKIGYIRDILSNKDVLFEELKRSRDYLEFSCFGESCEYKIVVFNDSLNRIESTSTDGSGVIFPERYHE